jgi:Flagellin hook IN motif
LSIQSLSFWQQDQNFWNQAQAQAQASAASDALIGAMGSLMANEAKGLASIANKTALDRVNSQLTAALQSALQTAQQASSDSSASSTTGAPAVGTGTVPLSSTTSLLTLGIPQNGTITVSDGTNTTTYASTGSDTVGDLINAINNPNVATDAQVTASLNAHGQLVLTGNNKSVSISVGGVFASSIGFGAKNDSFLPTAPASSSSSSSTASSSAATSATSGTTGSTGTSASASAPTASLFNSAYALQTSGTAETLLASSGLSGSLVNLLA